MINLIIDKVTQSSAILITPIQTTNCVAREHTCFLLKSLSYRTQRQQLSKRPRTGTIHQPLALSVGQLTVQIKLIKGGDTKIHVLPLPLGFRCKPRRLAVIVSSTSELFLVHRDPDVREEPPLDSANDPVLQ